MSEIANFYKGRSVFITGATGFLGKAVVEKLLRDCPEISRIYVFARPSKTARGEERVKELLSGELFDCLRKLSPGFESKVTAVEGDLILEGLGISNAQTEELRQNVSVILHCAATVNFNEKLSISLQVNVVSTQRLLSFAKTMSNMAAFIHVSTAYSQCDRLHIEEKLYPPTVNPQSLIDAVSSIQDETVISNITQPLVGKRPNTYTFTKSLAEDMVRTERENVPVAIVRPSIICGMHDGPIPGWVDNLNGPGGLYIAVGHNLVRGMPGNPDAVCDLIPVDFCSNMIIAAAWRVGTIKPSEIQVYNCTSGAANPINWGYQSEVVMKAILERPTTKPSFVRKPSFTMYKREKYFEYVFEPLFHLLPAHTIDLFLAVTGKKPLMKRLYRKIRASISAYTFFTSNDWKWDNENVNTLINSMNEIDIKTFNCDVKTISWEKYLNDYYDGCKKIVATKSTQPTAKFVGNDTKSSSLPPIFMVVLFLTVLAFFTIVSWSFFGNSFEFPVHHNETIAASSASSCSNGNLGPLATECH